MAERFKEVAEIPQQFVREGSLVSPPLCPPEIAVTPD